MARPRGFNLDDVTDALMNAFWLRGYGHTSLPDLVSATGLLRGSLYAAFGDKEAMFAIALEKYQAYLRRELASDAQGLAGLRHIFDVVVRLTADDPDRRGCLMINTISETGFLGPGNAQAVTDGMMGMHRLVRRRLEEEVSDAPMTPDLDEQVAMAFAALVSIRVLGRAGQPRTLLQQVADGAVASVERAFYPDAGEASSL